MDGLIGKIDVSHVGISAFPLWDRSHYNFFVVFMKGCSNVCRMQVNNLDRKIYLKLSQTVNLNFKRMNNNFKEE